MREKKSSKALKRAGIGETQQVLGTWAPPEL